MAYRVHGIFAYLSLFTIVTFFSSTIVAELFFEHQSIALVKSLIVAPGLFVLIPSLILTALTGNMIARKSKKLDLIAIKKRRTPKIAALGIFILIPCAIYLNFLASNMIFDLKYYLVQSLEIIAGATNIYLMAKNISDSIKAP